MRHSHRGFSPGTDIINLYWSSNIQNKRLQNNAVALLHSNVTFYYAMCFYIIRMVFSNRVQIVVFDFLAPDRHMRSRRPTGVQTLTSEGSDIRVGSIKQKFNFDKKF